MVPDAVRRLWCTLAGDDGTVDLLCGLDDPSDPHQIIAALRPARTLGPAALAYLPEGAGVADLDQGGHILEVPVASIRGWLDSLPADDVEESSVAEMEQVVALQRGKNLLGAAGHLSWPTEIAHVGVLVAPDARGAGVGTRLGAAATRRALAHGLTPQWRALESNEVSRRAARRIGYREIGRQISFQLRTAE